MNFLASWKNCALIFLCFLMLQGCQTTNTKPANDDLNIWLQTEMNKRGVIQSGQLSSSTLKGI